MEQSSSSSGHLVADVCDPFYAMHDDTEIMVEDLDGPGSSASGRASQGPSGLFAGLGAFRSGVSRTASNNKRSEDTSQPGAEVAEKVQSSALFSGRFAISQASGNDSTTQQQPAQQQDPPFSAQLQMLTSQLQLQQQLQAQQQQQQQAQQQQMRSSANGSASSNVMPRYTIVMMDSTASGMPGSESGVAPNSGSNAINQQPVHQSAPANAFISPAATSPSTLPPGLSQDQYNLLLQAGADPAMLSNVFAPKLQQQQVNATEQQLDAAEALWQQVAASGADDQTLLQVAATLGLISTDTGGNVVLTRELQLQQQQMLLPGQSALAGLLDTYGALRTTLTGQPGSATKGLGSPGPSKQHTLYKTELCRGWLETGTCRYGSKCQFAHGPEELRPVPRHPKYKTEVCRSFTATGMCAYGSRCRFIHGSISAPTNAVFGLDNSRLSNDFEGLEGVLSFEDPSPTQRGVSTESVRSGAISPRSRMLLSLSGGPLAVRNVAQQSSALTAQDAAAITRLGRFMNATGETGSQRASLESMLSSRMDTVMMNRSSVGDTQRSSMDSRAGGRTSLESTQSQQDWQMVDLSQQNVIPMHSPQKPGDVFGMPAQRFMPGIPEGVPVHEAPAWLGSNLFKQQQCEQQSNATAIAAAQLVGQLQGFAFPQQHQQRSVAPASAAAAAPRTSTMPAGSWFSGNRFVGDTISSAPSNVIRSASESDANKTFLSAYTSGLYASSAAGSAAGANAAAGKSQLNMPQRRLSPSSNPGLPTPEHSESHLNQGSDVNLAAILGL